MRDLLKMNKKHFPSAIDVLQNLFTYIRTSTWESKLWNFM